MKGELAALAARLGGHLAREAPPPREPARRQAAVLLPILPEPAGPEVLFTLRAERVESHKGQVSFPGGRIEPGEEPEAAAVRETGEELGVGPERIAVAGCLGGFPTLTSGWEIRAFLGLIVPGPLAPRAAEVARVFQVPLAELSRQRRRQRGEAGQPPVWPLFTCILAGEPGPPIWGATARILASFLDGLAEAGGYPM